MVIFLFMVLASYSQELNQIEPLDPPVVLEIEAEQEITQLSKDWEKLKDFQPEDLITFDMPAGHTYEFFEKIDKSPTSIQGAWFLGSESTNAVDFVVRDPNGRIIYQKSDSKEAVFNVNAEISGIFLIQFVSKKVMGSQSITLAFNSENSNSLLKTEHITPVEEKLVKIDKSIKDFQVDNQFAQLRQESHFNTVASANKYVFWFALAESFGVLAVTVWQVYYIKKLLDNRRVL